MILLICFMVVGAIAIVLTIFEVKYHHLKYETPEDYEKFKKL